MLVHEFQHRRRAEARPGAQQRGQRQRKALPRALPAGPEPAHQPLQDVRLGRCKLASLLAGDMRAASNAKY